MKAAYLTHPSFLLHEMGPHHPECPERLAVIADRLLLRGVSDYLDSIEAPEATIEQIVRAHDLRFFLELQASAPRDGYSQVDPDTTMNPHTWNAALHAAGAAVRATDLVVSGQYRRAFCAVRPPGHHAERARAMGFCFFNNVAVGVLHALDALGLQRVAVVDFDVHHGNGSEDILAGDDRVMMVSTFQSRLYPFLGENPRGPNMCNVPLEPYSGGASMRQAVLECWLPRMKAFAPQMIFVSAGFDAHLEDDMSHLGWRDDDYAWVTGQIARFADEHCEGRIVSLLEGGYQLAALARCVELHLRVLIGID
jgi:acetoin utilization deacetylase AcuC-like enzyme